MRGAGGGRCRCSACPASGWLALPPPSPRSPGDLTPRPEGGRRVRWRGGPALEPSRGQRARASLRPARPQGHLASSPPPGPPDFFRENVGGLSAPPTRSADPQLPKGWGNRSPTFPRAWPPGKSLAAGEGTWPRILSQELPGPSFRGKLLGGPRPPAGPPGGFRCRATGGWGREMLGQKTGQEEATSTRFPRPPLTPHYWLN